MKKCFRFLSLVLLYPTLVFATDDASDFYQNLLVSDEVIAAENKDIAIKNARRMLDTKPQTLKMKDNKVVHLPNRETIINSHATAETAKSKQT